VTPCDQPPIRELVIDFAGTLAVRSHGALTARDIVKALHHAYPWIAPPEFTAALHRAMTQARTRDQRTGRQTTCGDLLAHAATACGTRLPDTPDAAQAAVFATVPDAHIDPDAAHAIRTLAASGYRLLLADNTRRPQAARERTLNHAGILDCFDQVLLSSELGVRKPRGRFYTAVLRATEHPAAQVLFVGDNPAHDVEPPRTFGAHAVLVAPIGRRLDPLGTRPPLLAELPGLLRGARR
jgi:FMN phosphatase YigB (HAD superfamily)